MTCITIVWSMIAAACLTLAVQHFMIWCRLPAARGNVLFSLSAAATAAMAGCELWMMSAETPAEFGIALRWIHLPGWVVVLSLVGFVLVYLRAGRPWLAWTVCGVRTVSLILNFLFTPNLNYREITGLRHIPFLGDSVSVAEGVSNPWMLVGQASLVLLVAFVVDATIAVWRRGERRKAILVGFSAVFFVLAGAAQIILSLWGIVATPLTPSLFYLGILAGMAWELTDETLRAAKLSEELRESEQRLSLAAEVARFGLAMRDLGSGEIWATRAWRELFGFTADEPLEMERLLERVHPVDRGSVGQKLTAAVAARSRYEMEFRILLPDGRMRWVASRGRVEVDANGGPVRIRDASRDFTVRKLAEEAAHDLSGRLIHAEEKERMRFARELHDDLSQSLALLSVELDLFGGNPPPEPNEIASRARDFSAQVKALSSEVHQLSHELHPAKLKQLGLVAAVRGFCKEFALAHHLAVGFADREVPSAVPHDTALCLYRIAQEALRNVAKHSRATTANVELVRDDGHLRIVITDDGAGFDPQSTGDRGSLGLVSMCERARFAGGQLVVESQPGAGTRIQVSVPYATDEPPTPL